MLGDQPHGVPPDVAGAPLDDLVRHGPLLALEMGRSVGRPAPDGPDACRRVSRRSRVSEALVRGTARRGSGWRVAAAPGTVRIFRDVPNARSRRARPAVGGGPAGRLTLVLSAPTARRGCDRARATRPATPRAGSMPRAGARERAGRPVHRPRSARSSGCSTQAAGVETAIAEGEQRAATLRRIVQQARRARVHARRLELAVAAHRRRPPRPDAQRQAARHRERQRLRRAVAAARAAGGPPLKREDLRKLEDQQGGALADLQRASKRGRRAARRRAAQPPGRAGAARRAGRGDRGHAPRSRDASTRPRRARPGRRRHTSRPRRRPAVAAARARITTTRSSRASASARAAATTAS